MSAAHQTSIQWMLRRILGSQLAISMQVLGLADRTAANNFMVQNPNRVIGAVHFDVTSAEAVGYTLQTNSTVCVCS